MVMRRDADGDGEGLGRVICLTIDPETGVVSSNWKEYGGDVVVARKDRKALDYKTLETVADYVEGLRNGFEAGDTALAKALSNPKSLKD